MQFPCIQAVQTNKKELYCFLHNLQKKGRNLKPYLKTFLQAQQTL